MTTTYARLRASSGRLLAGLFLATCLIAPTLNTTAGAATPIAHISSTAEARIARLAAPRLEVIGHKLTWSRVNGVSSYVFARQRPGQRYAYRVIAKTSVLPQPVPGATVHYSVKTNVTGSAWAPPITIVYNRLGGISKILQVGGSGSDNSGTGSSSSSAGSSSSSGSSGSGAGSSGSSSTGSSPGSSGSSKSGSPSGSTGSGSSSTGSSGSGSTGSGSSGSSSGSTGSGSSSTGSTGSGSSSSGSGSSSTGSSSGSSGSSSLGGPIEEVTAPRTAALKVGLIGFTGWGSAAAETIRKATGVKYTRASPAQEGWGPAKELVSEGITPLVLYNPGLARISPATVAEGIKSYIPHMRELGLTEIELGNEVYYNGSTPAAYAAQYRAAHEALAGTGITLIANAWTDTERPNGEWSQWESKGGWCVLFVEALGYVPDAWSFHPYGPMSADGFGSGASRPGWETVPRMIAYMKADHIYAPLNITEVGQPTSQGTDGNTAVTEAEQSADVRQYLTQASEWGLASIYLYEAIDTGEGAYGFYSWPLKAKPSAAVFAETLTKLTAASTNVSSS